MPSADVATLTDLSHALLTAIRLPDRKALDSILTSDFVHVNETGARTAKDAFIAAIEAGGYEITQLSFEFLVVEPLADIGIVCGVQVAQVRLAGGEEVAGRTAFTDVFVRTGGGRWQLRMATSAELVSKPK